MKKLVLAISIFVGLLSFMLCNSQTDFSNEWQYPLYLANNGFWKQRIPITIQNSTDFSLKGGPISFIVGNGKNELPLKGILAESIRVTNAEGNQLLYKITNPNGSLVQRGAIPSGAKLTIPAENKKGEKKTYLIYFDNDAAWPVGEYFYTHREISNGSFEMFTETKPVDWELYWPEENRSISWSKSQAYAGKHSLEIKSSKVETESFIGASQSDIHILPGVTYEMEVWFKTENLDGEAGVLLVPANLERTKRDLRFKPFRIIAKTGTNKWEKSILNFTAPEGSNILTISSFINGSGKLWIDDIMLTSKSDYNLSTEIFPIERSSVKNSGKTNTWFVGADSNNWPIRAAITVPNFSDSTLTNYPIYVDIQQLSNRLYNEIDENTVMKVINGTNPIPHLTLGNALLFKQDIPASTVQTFYVYFSSKGLKGVDKNGKELTKLSELSKNFINNPRFDTKISGWKKFGESESNIITNTKEGDNFLAEVKYAETQDAAKAKVHDIEVTHINAEAGVGLYQTFNVKSGADYLFSAQVKSSKILNRPRTLRARFLNKKGELTGDEKYLQANPDMHQNNQWVKESMIISVPEDVNSIRVELLNTEEGIVWYDDVFFMEIGNGYTGALAVERIAEKNITGIEVWEKNPMEKVFPDDLPNKKLDKIIMSAAKNDAEPSQILFRSDKDYKNLEVRIKSLSDNNGNTLDSIDIGTVGYVPINYPSNYYRDFETPFWQTKIPKGKIGSDGWTGWWPDPVIPFSNFDLNKNETKAVWLEVSVSNSAVAGLYKGRLEILHNGKIVKEIPLEMQVYDFILPQKSSVKAVYDLRFNERNFFGNKTTEQQQNEEVWKYMAKHKVSPETIRPQPKFTVKDGEVTVDFTEFDEAAVYYFDELKFTSTYTPWDFYLFGWGHPPRDKFGEKPYHGEAPYHGVDHSKLRPEYIKVYQSALRQYWDHMKEKGWADKVVMYISDEPHDDPEMLKQVKAVCNMIHEVDPEIPIYVSTWWYRPEFEGYVNLWGVSHRGGGWGHPVPPEHLQEITKNGGEVFFTTDGMQCTDTPYLAFERMLPYFCYKYGASEYEFWAANWHTFNPYEYGWHRYHRQSPSADVWYWMRYPNGDGNFVYPGQPIGVDGLVSTIRLKQAREGVEDYEFMNIIGDLIERSKAKGIDVAEAQKALDRALELVTIPCADGRYTTGYSPDPDVLMQIRHEMATAIEQLSKRVN